MSYNPARTSGKTNNSRKSRAYNPHAGTKHSDIIRRKGLGFDASSAEREKTLHGFTSPIFSCDSFTQRYVCLSAGNNTGIGVNSKGDRTVRVAVGSLYVTTITKVKDTDEDGKVTVSDVSEIKKYDAGFSVSFPKGTRYSLAASGTSNVELIMTETTGYQKDWVELDVGSTRVMESAMFVAPRTSTPTRRPRGESKAYAQAVASTGRQGLPETRKRQTNENVNSSTIIGVNPRPSGPPTDD